MGKYTKICYECGRTKKLHTITRRCVDCYNMGRSVANTPFKECENCGKDIPKVIEGKILNPARYKRKRFCNRSCSSSNTIFKMRARGWESSTRYPKIEKPSLEKLNRLFSEVKSYKKMADRLGVSKGLISKWMGNKKYLVNPKLLERKHY